MEHQLGGFTWPRASFSTIPGMRLPWRPRRSTRSRTSNMRQEKSVDFNVFEHVVFSENDEENPNKKLVICWWNTRPNHVGRAKQLAQWSFVKWVSCGEMDNSTLITQKNINWDMEDWCTWRSQVQGWNDSTLKLWLFWVTKPASCKGWDLDLGGCQRVARNQ